MKKLMTLVLALVLMALPLNAMVNTSTRVCFVWVVYTQMGVFFVPYCYNTTTCTVQTPCR